MQPAQMHGLGLVPRNAIAHRQCDPNLLGVNVDVCMGTCTGCGMCCVRVLLRFLRTAVLVHSYPVSARAGAVLLFSGGGEDAAGGGLLGGGDDG